MKLLVLGASGGIGRCLVRLALSRGHETTGLFRASSCCNAPAGATVVRGDPLDANVIEPLVRDADGVVCALGLRRAWPGHPWTSIVGPTDLVSRAMRNVVQACETHGPRRVAFVSAAGVGDSLEHTCAPMRWLIAHSNLGPAYADLDRAERVLRESELVWAAARPTTLISAGREVRETNHYDSWSLASRAGVAEWMVRFVEDPLDYAGRTPMLTTL